MSDIEERTVYEIYDDGEDYYNTGMTREEAEGWIKYYSSFTPLDPVNLHIVEVRQRRRVGEWNWMSVFDDDTPDRFRPENTRHRYTLGKE